MDSFKAQLNSNGSEEDNVEAFLTSPNVLSELSNEMRNELHKSAQNESHRAKQSAEMRAGIKDATLNSATTGYVKLLLSLENQPMTEASRKSLSDSIFEMFFKMLKVDIESHVDSLTKNELYTEPVEAILPKEEQARVTAAQGRCINQLVGFLSAFGNTAAPERKVGERLRIMLSYNWDHVCLIRYFHANDGSNRLLWTLQGASPPKRILSVMSGSISSRCGKLVNLLNSSDGHLFSQPLSTMEWLLRFKRPTA